MRKLDKVTFATKRQVSDSSNEKIKLMTAYEECLEIFVFHRPGNEIGIEVKLADNKQLDKANAIIGNLTQKLTNELNMITQVSGPRGWQLDNVSIANLYGITLKDPLFKPAIPSSATLTFSTQGLFVSLDSTLRPQLSYSFPLCNMQQVFNMLNRNEASAPRLLRIKETLDKPLPSYRRSVESSRRERIAGFQKLDILKKLLTSSQLDDVGGLCLLVSSYIYELFVLNDMPISNPETGPKAFLKVVSRVPFSAICEQLSGSEQEAFENFCDGFPQDLMDALIKPYRKDAPESTYETTQDDKGTYVKDHERICLTEWLISILHPANRSRSSEVVVMRDLLSPPPHTAKDYSMGAVEISKLNRRFALLEARGYAGMQLHSIFSQGKIDISLDNIEKLINGEAEVFFTLKTGD